MVTTRKPGYASPPTTVMPAGIVFGHPDPRLSLGGSTPTGEAPAATAPSTPAFTYPNVNLHVSPVVNPNIVPAPPVQPQPAPPVVSAPPAQASTIPWVPILIGAGVIAVGVLVYRSRKADGSVAYDETGTVLDNPTRGDEEQAEELVLYAENDEPLYRQMRRPIEKNLLRKMQAKKYNRELAIKAYMHLADAAAKKYAKEFAQPHEWNQIFTVETRRLAAKQMRDSYEPEAKIELKRLAKSGK